MSLWLSDRRGVAGGALPMLAANELMKPISSGDKLLRMRRDIKKCISASAQTSRHVFCGNSDVSCLVVLATSGTGA